MGSSSSGRRQQYGKRTTSDLRPLDIRRLQREGCITAGRIFNWQWTRNGEETGSIQIKVKDTHLYLVYQNKSRGGDWESMNYPVWLEWTECHLGGKRLWFRCPNYECGRRVAILFSGRMFVCRHCHDLAYASQRENAEDRVLRRGNKIRRKLGWRAGIANPKGFKPKGMHWRTFDRLNRQYDGYADLARLNLVEWFRKMNS